jgi:hypothetical protein
MVNKEAAAVLVEYSQHIAHYAAIADVPEKTETILTKAARGYAWRLLNKVICLAEAAKESDTYWLMLNSDNTPKESYRLHSIAKQEDRKFMEAKLDLAEMLKEIRAIERKDPTGKKRQAEFNEDEKQRAESKELHELAKKEHARQRREERKAEKLAIAAAEVVAATKKAKLPTRKNVASA